MSDRQAFVIASVMTYVIAVYAGTLTAEPIFESDNMEITQFTLMWLGFAFASFLTFFIAFRLSWKYLFWVAGTYLFQLFGVMLLMTVEDPGSVEYVTFGFMVFLSFAVLLSLIWKVKEVRDDLAHSPDVNVEYVPLGLWSIQVLMAGSFLMMSLISYFVWTRDGGDLIYFEFFQTVFAILMITAFWTPEKLMFVYRKDIPQEIREKRERTEVRRALKKDIPEDTCPLCGSKLLMEKRRCAECQAVYDFNWCPTSEEYIITCPFCNLPTPYGREVCIHCERNLQTSIRCPSCEKVTPLSEWMEGY